MLVLRRRIGEAIVLNGVIKIYVLAIESGDKVKLGIEAPPDVIVVRDELLDEAGTSVDRYGVRHCNGSYQPRSARTREAS